MAWLALVGAGLIEIGWAWAIKESNGFTRLIPSIIVLVTIAPSVFLLSYAMKSLPLATSYIAWTGIGAFGTFLIGTLVLGETLTLYRALSALLILCGLIGLKLASPD
ncbi:Quaternary ammonium compound-resistance protein SugE [Methyloligella halotolerans]|uniref:Guanidinium exporter n=1 Tax=Methyloligella halotolerans TaxID=1177755 RepID=A0A1E2RV69_9HYPH|nr:SMR family transporter [Methyloligella halotolerans]ODA66124.1 Quaternary ammonium compound-resistance protein SugE [Methyloligella halotolerans]